MMVSFAVAREGLESVFFLLAASQQDVGIWTAARLCWAGASLAAVVRWALLYCQAVSALNPGASFRTDQPVYSCWRRQGWRLGDPRLHEAAWVNPISVDVASDPQQQRPFHPLSDWHPAWKVHLRLLQ